MNRKQAALRLAQHAAPGIVRDFLTALLSAGLVQWLGWGWWFVVVLGFIAVGYLGSLAFVLWKLPQRQKR